MGLNIFFTTFSPGQQWSRFSGEARKVKDRDGQLKKAEQEGVDFDDKDCLIIPVYSTAVGAGEDAGGGEEVTGGSVEKQLQDAARARVPGKGTFGATYRRGAGQGAFSEAENNRRMALAFKLAKDDPDTYNKDTDLAWNAATEIVQAEKLTAQRGFVGMCVWLPPPE